MILFWFAECCIPKLNMSLPIFTRVLLPVWAKALRSGAKPYEVKKYFVRDVRLGGQTVLHSDDFFTQ